MPVREVIEPMWKELMCIVERTLVGRMPSRRFSLCTQGYMLK